MRLSNGREKELKAIIGRQELTIQDLHAKLRIANKIIVSLLCLNIKE